MTFKRWIKNSGLSESSAKKYSSAVFGSISEWAKDDGLIKTSLIEISDPEKFEIIADKVKQLPIFIERNEKGNNMYSSALNKYSDFLNEEIDELEEDIESIIADNSKDITDKVTLINTRIGQGKFRKCLLNYWEGCAVTGYKIQNLLIASHIKPWRDSSNKERLDTYNGLLLTPSIDKAFDTGFISFNSKGEILISNILEKPDLLGIKNEMKIKLEKAHLRYLEYHRDVVFMNF